MRVLLVGDYPPPAGGVAVHVRQLQAFLALRGLEVRVLDIGKGAHRKLGVTPVRAAPALVREVFHHARAGWIVHLHTSGNNPKSWMVAAACAAATAAGTGRAVLTVHSGLSPVFLAGSATHRLLARGALLGFERVVAVSEAVGSALRSLGVSARRLSVAPAFLADCVEPGPLPEGFDRLRQTRRPLLCVAHHPSPVYGRAFLMNALRDAATRWPEVGLAFFGPGAESGELRALAAVSGVAAHVEGLGELEHPQALAVMAQSDVFLRPTLADGDAMSVREALALGVPCLASDVAARPEGTHVYRSGDIRSFVEGLGTALEASRARRVPADAGDHLLQLYSQLEENPHVAIEAQVRPERA
jgi:glycogen synthase